MTPAKAVRGQGTLQGSTATCWRDEAGRGAERQAGLGGASSASPPARNVGSDLSFLPLALSFLTCETRIKVRARMF